MPLEPRAKRLGEIDRTPVHLYVDSIAVEALEGDTVLTAILLSTGRTGSDSFNKTNEAGFCLMGSCQSCWIWTADGRRLRACDTEVQDGLKLFTRSDRIDG